MRRSARPHRRAAITHLGQWTQLLRDAEYGRLPKVLEALRAMTPSEVGEVSGNVIVRGIERCTFAKLPALLAIIDLVATQTCAVNEPATLGSTKTFPLVRAAYRGLPQVVDRLLEHGAAVSDVAGNSASTLESTFSAAVRRSTRSEPASGSEKPWHQSTSPADMRGR